MSHSIRAIIAKSKVTQEFCDRWILAKAILLPQDFSLVLIPDDLLDDIYELIDSKPENVYPEFDYLNEKAVAFSLF